jgi:type IV pilus biogenesis protein CpaD/CtpE
MTTVSRMTALIGLLAIIQGCAATDPLLNENDWRPTGVNERNIAAEVVNPADLSHGQEAKEGSDGQLAAAAILRLRTGHVKKLPDSAITDLQVQSSGAPAGGP